LPSHLLIAILSSKLLDLTNLLQLHLLAQHQRLGQD
jgi:hypothetical protein